MSHRIGDTIFTAQGLPSVIVGRSPDGAHLHVQSHGEAIDATKKRGYINGLTENERGRFNEIIDVARRESDPNMRIEKLREQIDVLKADPANFALVRYLEAEVSHTMITNGIKPRVFSVPEAYTK